MICRFILQCLEVAFLVELLLFFGGLLPFELELIELRDPYLKF
jgi:hypothetical protein